MKSTLAILFAASLLTACTNQATSAKIPEGQLTLSKGAKQELETKGKIVASAGAANKQEDEVVCRQEEIVGSHRKRVVCMTREERAQVTKEAQEAARDMQGPGVNTRMGD